LIKNSRKVFGLSKPKIRTIAEKVIDVVSNWLDYCEKADVSKAESEKLYKVFCL